MFGNLPLFPNMHDRLRLHGMLTRGLCACSLYDILRGCLYSLANVNISEALHLYTKATKAASTSIAILFVVLI